MARHRTQPTTATSRGVRWRIMATSLVVVLVACSCGGDDDAESSTTTSSSESRRTTTTEAGECTTLLENGCEAETVRNLQRLLQRKIDQTVGVTGKFGDQTEDVLRTFEQTCDVCVADGRILVNGDEWDELDGRDDLPTTTVELSPG